MKDDMKLNLSAIFITTIKTLTLVPLSLPSSACLWFLLVSTLCSICFCNQNSDHVLCIPTERLALIDLKNNLTDESNRLSSWVGKECCNWTGVVCDNITGHVHELHLRGPEDGTQGHCLSYFSFEAPSRALGGTISPSVIKLLQLRYLDLSCNFFGNILIPEFIGSFQNLIYLNLSYSQFGGEIPHQLGNLSTLRFLDLHREGINMTEYENDLHAKSLKWLVNLKGLRHLDMDNINLTKASDWFLAIRNLSSLLELHLSMCGLTLLPSNPTTVSFTSLIRLDLSYNNFQNSMLPGWIFSLPNLVFLDLTYCSFSGVNTGTHGGFHSMVSLRDLRVSGNTFVNSSSILNGLPSVRNLRMLDVSYCDISSPILGNLQNLSSIEYFDLSFNRIVEEIPKSLSNICNIATIDLQSNNFFGNVSELLERFCECESPKLKVLAFGGNYLIGQLPERLGKLKNLTKINLGYNNLTGTIPDSLGNLSLLMDLDISNNQLSGSIPHTINRLSSLDRCNLSHNNIQGELGNITFLPSYSINLDLSNNHLYGMLPATFNSMGMYSLDLSNNNLSGSLEPFLCYGVQETRRLSLLNLANNNMSGVIPDCWMHYTYLLVLNLEKNQFSGIIPPSLGDISSLQLLDMDDNRLSGNLPMWLLSPNSLIAIELAENELTGKIPSPIGGDFTNLRVLTLRSNKLEGKIPDEICLLSSIQILDLAHND